MKFGSVLARKPSEEIYPEGNRNGKGKQIRRRLRYLYPRFAHHARQNKDQGDEEYTLSAGSEEGRPLHIPKALIELIHKGRVSKNGEGKT